MAASQLFMLTCSLVIPRPHPLGGTHGRGTRLVDVKQLRGLIEDDIYISPSLTPRPNPLTRKGLVSQA